MTSLVPKPRGGLLHILDAAGYSWAGAKRLMQEPAARLELGGALIGMVLLLIKGAPAQAFLLFAALCALVLILEALNTALEEIIDHISPDWSQMAKNAKDLGSCAVAIGLILAGGYLALILFTF